MSNLLIKKTNLEVEKVFPKTYIHNITDKSSNKTLALILNSFNMYFLSYTGNVSTTRCLVPMILRKKGLWITYVKYDGNVCTEWYAASDIDDESWGDSSNWRIGNNMLVGDITISANGNWIINGTETEFKAIGEKGNTPLIRISDNRLLVSYDLGDTYSNVNENPVYTQFRNYNNKLQVSTDLGTTWKDCSEPIAAWFRWTDTSGTGKAGKILISRDLLNWSDLSPNIGNNVADEEDLTVEYSDLLGINTLKLANRDNTNGMGYIILRKNKSFAEQVTQENTIYVIQYDFDLNGEEGVTIPKNCVLQFKGGSLSNGTVVGNGTAIKAELVKIFGEDITISGDWSVSIAYSEWFSKEATYQNNVISNLAKLSRFIRLEPITFNIKKNGTLSIVISELIGYGATMSFDDGADSSGNNVRGILFRGANIVVKGLSFTENFITGSTNNPLIGSMIEAGGSTEERRLSFEDCNFSGAFSSSCFAASDLSYFHAKNIKANNCTCADHIFYCSTKIKEYILENIECDNSQVRSSLFKIRDSEYFKLYKVDSLHALNSQDNSYIFEIHMTDSNESAIIDFNNIVVERQNNNGLFCMISKGVVSQISLKNSRLINPISSSISLFWEGGTTFISRVSIIEISNCFIQGFTLGYEDANTYIYSSEFHGWTLNIAAYNAKFNATNCIFETSNVINTLFSYIKYISLNNCDIIIPYITYLIDKRYVAQENTSYSIFNCKVSALGRNVFLADDTTKPFNYSCDVNIPANTNYNIVTGGAGDALILNAKSGKFRPILTSLDKGYQFYDTNLSPNRPIWYNGTYWADVTGTRVTWPITFALTNVSASNMRQPTAEVSYSTKLSADSGYTLPGSITIKMGSNTLSEGADYTYDTSTGDVVILGVGGSGGVTAALTITASGVTD